MEWNGLFTDSNQIERCSMSTPYIYMFTVGVMLLACIPFFHRFRGGLIEKTVFLARFMGGLSPREHLTVQSRAYREDGDGSPFFVFTLPTLISSGTSPWSVS